MAYRHRTTFTRADANTEWPFWAAALVGTPFETANDAFLNWIGDRDDAEVTPVIESSTVAHIDLSFVDQAAYDAYVVDLTSAGHDGLLEIDAFTSYNTANNITVTTSVGEVSD